MTNTQDLINSYQLILHQNDIPLHYKFQMLHLLYDNIPGLKNTFHQLKKSYLTQQLNEILHTFQHTPHLNHKAQLFNQLTTIFYPLIRDTQAWAQSQYSQIEETMLLDWEEIEHTQTLPPLTAGLHPLHNYLSLPGGMSPNNDSTNSEK